MKDGCYSARENTKERKDQCDSLVHSEVMIFIDAGGVLCRE